MSCSMKSGILRQRDSRVLTAHTAYTVPAPMLTLILKQPDFLLTILVTFRDENDYCLSRTEGSPLDVATKNS